MNNRIQWKFNPNWNIFIQESALGIVVWTIAAILSRPQCVNCSDIRRYNVNQVGMYPVRIKAVACKVDSLQKTTDLIYALQKRSNTLLLC